LTSFLEFRNRFKKTQEKLGIVKLKKGLRNSWEKL